MTTTDDLVTKLLPILDRSLDIGFNVFDVMHHGTHEKQLSNVFGWLLDTGGTHNLGDKFSRIFIDEVNQHISEDTPFSHGASRVRQEVNTTGVDGEADIADLVLETSTARIVVENYFTSDGHGHDFQRYLDFGRSDGRQSAVVLLCRDEDRSRLSHGWENAVVLTYSSLIDKLRDAVDGDVKYRRENLDAYLFISQLHRKFVREGGQLEDGEVLKFVTVMCDTGEAERYRVTRQDTAAEQFASDMAVQARKRFVEGRELLQRINALLKTFAAGPLSEQLSTTLGSERIHKVDGRYGGIYRWTINLHITEIMGNDDTSIQLKFGPPAWFANESDPYWKTKVDPSNVDYSCVFVTRIDTKEIRQASVTLREVLDGLEPTDHRLHGEIVSLLEPESSK